MRKYHLPIVGLKTDSVDEVLQKLQELEMFEGQDLVEPTTGAKASKAKQETRLFIRHKDEQDKDSETPFLGTISDLKKYLKSAIGNTSVNMFAAKMRSVINS